MMSVFNKSEVKHRCHQKTRLWWQVMYDWFLSTDFSKNHKHDM